MQPELIVLLKPRVLWWQELMIIDSLFQLLLDATCSQLNVADLSSTVLTAFGRHEPACALMSLNPSKPEI